MFLSDAVFHPPIEHVESLGKLLAHLGVQDALGCAVFCLERGSGKWLRVSEFFEGGANGTSVFAADVNGAGLGFCGRTDNVFIV